MKTLNYLLLAIMAICLISCGGSQKSNDSSSSLDELEELTEKASDVASEATDLFNQASSAAEALSSLSDSESDDETSSSSSSSSEDWDSVLKSYESYVDQYISVMKKAQSGDLSAMTEYVNLLEQAQELSDKLSKAEDDMSTSQWAKYMKITEKLTKAASQM